MVELVRFFAQKNKTAILPISPPVLYQDSGLYRIRLDLGVNNTVRQFPIAESAYSCILDAGKFVGETGKRGILGLNPWL